MRGDRSSFFFVENHGTPEAARLGEHKVERRLLGLDVGKKSIGIAVSDPLGLTAQGLGVWRRRGSEKDLQHIRKLCDTYNVAGIVVGFPLRTDGSRGPEAEEVEAFAQKLAQATGRDVILWDERFTTRIAQRILLEAGLSRSRRKEVVDMTAAVLILQGYLERSGDGERTRGDRPGR